MKAALSSDEMGFVQRTFDGTVSFNDQATDQALVATAKMGDPQAFERLVKRHRPRIFALALRYTRLREDAEDVVQQTFQKTFVHLSSFADKSSFSTWLTSVAINESLMCLRRARALREVFIADLNGDEKTAPHLDVIDASPDPEANYLKREEAEVLSAAIDNLTRQVRTAIKLRELGELSTQETARHMRLSVGAVKAHVFRGKRKLRKTLRGLGITARGAQKTRSTKSCILGKCKSEFPAPRSGDHRGLSYPAIHEEERHLDSFVNSGILHETHQRRGVTDSRQYRNLRGGVRC